MNRICHFLRVLKPVFLLGFRNTVSATSIGTVDKYHGLHIDLTKPINCTDDELLASINRICSDKPAPVSSVWVSLTFKHFHLLPELCQVPPGGPGLTIHHAHGLSALLVRWLASTPNRLPDFATHQVGVAGVVLSPNSDYVLMVREKSTSLFQGWKFPTGLSHPGEYIADAVQRETYEETGVSARFRGILAFRQQHEFPGAFGRSDMFFICRLELKSSSNELPELRACPNELSACAWIPLRKLQCAHIHSTIDQPQDNFASEEDLHITTLTHKTIQLITSNAVNPHVELRPERVESVRQGQFYDLFIPCPWTVHSK